MKINIQNDYGLYRKKLGDSSVGKTVRSESLSSTKVDTNAISKGNTKLPDKQMLIMKSGVQSYVAAPSDASYLSGLREGVQSGSYKIDSERIAKSILGDF